jgi:CBS domain-containing protein
MQTDDLSRDHVPVRIRTRRTLSGNGAIAVERSVSCPQRDGDLPLQTCLARDCCAGFEDDALGTHVLCEDPGKLATQLVHLPVREPGDRALNGRSRADRTTIAAIMTPDVLCVRADVAVDTLVPLLLQHGISGVPVVDATGAPVGIVSKTDLVRERYENDGAGELRSDAVRERGFHESDVGGRLVADVMAGMTFALPEDATISQACALMAYEGVHRVPVVCAEGKVVGILSALDVLRWLATTDGYLIGRPHG